MRIVCETLWNHLVVALSAVLLFACSSATEEAPNQDPMIVRHASITASVVRVLVPGASEGTGFIVSSDGLIATAFHVVGERTVDPDGKPGVRFALDISVELPGGRTISALPVHGIDEEIVSKDFAVLKVDASNLPPLRLGKFSDAREGAEVYTAGFPLGVEQPIVATGRISTKWEAPGRIPGTKRDVAWLALTMNAGNSGGPIVLMGERPDDDRVIGIAVFNLNPFAKEARRLADATEKSGADMIMGGLSIKDVAKLTTSALRASSLGVGACVSIDYLAARVP